jgi:hypothetical protein
MHLREQRQMTSKATTIRRGNDVLDADGAEAIAREVNAVLSPTGTSITADHVRRSYAAEKRFREMQLDIIHRRAAKTLADDLQATADMFEAMGVPISVSELRFYRIAKNKELLLERNISVSTESPGRFRHHCHDSMHSQERRPPRAAERLGPGPL